MDSSASGSRHIHLPETVAQKLCLDFETALYEAVVSVEPCNVDALFSLGDMYTKTGRYREGLEEGEEATGALWASDTLY